MPATIFPYPWQQPSVDKLTRILQTNQFAIDSSSTGCGKTVISLQVIKNLACKTLVIAPKAVKTSWLRTAAAMDCSELLIDVINPERLQYKNPYVTDLQWKIPKDTLLAWDEVHRGASGANSKTTKILAATKPQGISVLAMSATIASSPLQLRAIGYLAGLHQFRAASFFEWCRANGCSRMAYANNALVFCKGSRGRDIMLKINEQLKPIMTRIRLEDVPDFPETRIVAGLFDIDAKYTAEIAKAVEEMRDELKKPSSNPLTVRLHARERTELCKVSLLEDLIAEGIEEDKSVVVFINFRSTLAELQARCILKGYKTGWIHGGQKAEERQGFLDDFQMDKLQVLICTVQAGGVGINLHNNLPGTRDRISLITPSDSCSDFVQALGRIHRSGGGPSVQTIVLAAGTVEEKIHANLQGKLDNLKSLNDGVLSDEDLKL